MPANEASLLRRAVRVAGSVPVGLTLMALLAAYVGLASVWPGWLARLLGTRPQGVYRHWLPVTLGALLCASILIATVVRIPLRLRHAGAWCSHAGVLVLAAGAAWYASFGVSGYCVTLRAGSASGWTDANIAVTADPWTPLTAFFLRDSFTAYDADEGNAPVQTPLPQTVRVLSAEYATYPGSVVPKDYRCRVHIGRPGDHRTETISLNHPIHVGKYQLSHNAWLPSPEAPKVLVFDVRTRPGLPVIWTGLAMIVAGMIFAFYVKPLVLRWRARVQP